MANGTKGTPIIVEGNGCWLQNIMIIGEPGVQYDGPPIRFIGHDCLAMDIGWTDQWSEPADAGVKGRIVGHLIEEES